MILLLNVFFVVFEVVLLVKIGGFGDMVGVCVNVLWCVGMKVMVMLLGYFDVIMQLQYMCIVCEWIDLLGGCVCLLNGCMGVQGILVLLFDVLVLFVWFGNFYFDDYGQLYDDNVLCFVVFSQVVVCVVGGVFGVYCFDIVQVYDWYVGLVLLFVKCVQVLVKIVFMIYNFVFQGNFLMYVVLEIGVLFDVVYEVEFWGQFSFLKVGLFWVDCIIMVSYVYVCEILIGIVGCGMQDLLCVCQ